MLTKVLAALSVIGIVFSLYAVEPISGFSAFPWGTKYDSVVNMMAIAINDSNSDYITPIKGEQGHKIDSALSKETSGEWSNGEERDFIMVQDRYVEGSNGIIGAFRLLFTDSIRILNVNGKKDYYFVGDSLVAGRIALFNSINDDSILSNYDALLTTLTQKYGKPVYTTLFKFNNMGYCERQGILRWYDGKGEIALFLFIRGNLSLENTKENNAANLHKAIKERQCGIKYHGIYYISKLFLSSQKQHRIRLDADYIAQQKADSARAMNDKLQKMKADY